MILMIISIYWGVSKNSNDIPNILMIFPKAERYVEDWDDNLKVSVRSRRFGLDFVTLDKILNISMILRRAGYDSDHMDYKVQ